MENCLMKKFANWFTDLKVKNKLIFGYLTVTIVSAVIGLVGILTILAMNNGSHANYTTSIIVIAVIFAAELILALIISNGTAKSLTKQMGFNERLAERIGTGNLDTSDILTSYMKGNGGGGMDRKDEIGAFTRSFKAVINKVRASLNIIETIGKGDLTVDVPTTSAQDQLGNGLKELVENFHHLVETIVTAIDQVASGAELVSNSSSALSMGTTQQASSVQELTASLEQISHQTHLNAENAEKANELAKNAKTNADRGNVQMKDMLKAMDEINISSGNINKIIKVIEDIAFQTNILALNAAVEAARAGQHGKGFAVVAEEVRSLAAKSANAAKETTELIEGSIRKVDAGTKIANETAAALNEIVIQVEKAADLINSIAIASTEQALSIEQVNQGIMQVSQVIQTNAATSEESAAASEELSAQAVQLKENVSIFKLKSTGKSQSAFTANRKPAGRSTSAAARPALSGAASRISLGDSDFGKY
jgi:methyl-accepting chemotaxis protein